MEATRRIQVQSPVRLSTSYQPGAELLSQTIGLPPLLPVGGGVWCCMATITPEMAELILSHYHIDRNRRPKKGLIDQLASDMVGGKWRMTHQGIAFNAAGQLVDGQHRLRACCESQQPFSTLVFFNPAPAACEALDQGVKRSVADCAKMIGVEFTHSQAAIVKFLLAGRHPVRISAGAILQAADIFADALDFVGRHVGFSGQRGVTTAPVCGAIGRAFYHVDVERLAKFSETIAGRPPHDFDITTDRVALQVQGWLKDVAGGAGGAKAQRIIYSKVQTAIRHFVCGTIVTRIVPQSRDMFPLRPDIQQQLTEAGVPYQVSALAAGE